MIATPKASSTDTTAPSNSAWARLTPTDEAVTCLADVAVRSEVHSATLLSASACAALRWSRRPVRSSTRAVASGAASPPAAAMRPLRSRIWASRSASSPSTSLCAVWLSWSR